MDATTLRRYLKPSPTLRWHPWAPLVAGLALLGFVFLFGMRWGYAAAERERAKYDSVPAFTVVVQERLRQGAPAKAMMFEADRIDFAVRRLVERSAQPQTAWTRWRDRAEEIVFRGGRSLPDLTHEDMKRLADFRLQELSAAAPRWAATASFCDETGAYRFGDEDLANRYFDSARAYSALLGREIAPQQLMPAVSGGKCPGTHQGKTP